jgi:hypothetical protein
MEARFRSWWQQIKQQSFIATGIIVVLVVAIAFIFAAYRFGWSGTGFLNKTVWDWLQLLIIPLALAIIAILFNRSERKNEQRVASDNQQETALQEYIKEMSELLLHGKLRESQPGDEVRTIARVRTLTVLLRLDKERKISVLQFLYESGLIKMDGNLVKLFGANFNKIAMFNGNMSNVDLSGIILTEANLGGVYLQGTNLQRADLTKAVLSMSKQNKTNLSTSILSSTTLSVLNRHGKYYMSSILDVMSEYVSENNLLGINLSNATLNEADLRGSNLTKVDLNWSYLLKTKLQNANLIEANLQKALQLHFFGGRVL